MNLYICLIKKIEKQNANMISYKNDFIILLKIFLYIFKKVSIKIKELKSIKKFDKT